MMREPESRQRGFLLVTGLVSILLLISVLVLIIDFQNEELVHDKMLTKKLTKTPTDVLEKLDRIETLIMEIKQDL